MQVRALRDGKECLISTYDIMVGDVLHIEQGDIVQADGILFDGGELK